MTPANQGFPPAAGRRVIGDARLDGGTSLVICGRCAQVVPSGTAHIVISPYGPDMHVMYCPDHCPCTPRGRG